MIKETFLLCALWPSILVKVRIYSITLFYTGISRMVSQVAQRNISEGSVLGQRVMQARLNQGMCETI